MEVLLIWWCIPCARSHLDISGYLSPPTLCLTALRNARSLPCHRLTWLPSIPLTDPLTSALPRYSYTLFDIAVSRVPRGRYSHCMPCRHNTLVGRRERHKVDDAPECRRIVWDSDGGTGRETRSPRERKYNSMYNVWTLLECLMKSCLISNNASKHSFASKSLL